MLMGAATVLHRLLTMSWSQRWTTGLTCALAVTLSLVAVLHVRSKDSTLHQAVFGIMIVTVCFKTIHHLKTEVTLPEIRQRQRFNAGLGACRWWKPKPLSQCD